MVDFDALARVIRSRGGAAMLPAHTPRSLVVGAFVVGENNIPETSQRYAQHLGESGPDDVFEVRNIEHAPLTLAQALATLRLSGWDSHVFLPMFPALLEMAPAASGRTRTDLALAMRRIWAGWFPIGETADVALCVGLILSAIGQHRDALGYFARSHEQHGPNANAFLASAIARQGLCEPDAALKDLAEALALEPDLDAARALVLEIESSLGVDDGGATQS
jgi:tetratricopeptide (TPR) repeat protein